MCSPPLSLCALVSFAPSFRSKNEGRTLEAAPTINRHSIRGAQHSAAHSQVSRPPGAGLLIYPPCGRANTQMKERAKALASLMDSLLLLRCAALRGGGGEGALFTRSLSALRANLIDPRPLACHRAPPIRRVSILVAIPLRSVASLRFVLCARSICSIGTNETPGRLAPLCPAALCFAAMASVLLMARVVGGRPACMGA